MLRQIPTHLIAGPLGAGKTSLLRHLLTERPAGESWAILINEFGQIGIDAALLETTGDAVQLAEIPGGCLCCVNGLPFQIGLVRLLRKARPDRLFIEASGLGHPAALLQQLAAPPWQEVLALQPLVMVLDTPAMLADQPLPESQLSVLPLAGLIIMNKAATADMAQRRRLQASLAPVAALHWCNHGDLAFDQLPQLAADLPIANANTPLPAANMTDVPPRLWRSVEDWQCLEQLQDGVFSIGWQIHPRQRFVQKQLAQWLADFPWLRAKGIVHTDAGWLSFNALDGQQPTWLESPWRKDNRIELLMVHTPQREDLERDLRSSRLTD